MNRSVPPIALVALGFMCAANAWGINILVGELNSTERAQGSPHLTAASIPAENPLAIRQPPISAYADLTARPIFFKSRKPYAPPARIAPAVAAPVPPPPPVPQLTVTGVFLGEGTKRAFIVTQGGPGAWLTTGDTVAGWQLEQIDAKGIAVRHNDRVLQFSLYPPN